MPSVVDAIASIVAAGHTIADLKARLAEAEQSIAVLHARNRQLQAELRAVARGLPQRPPFRHARSAATRSHLDDALAAVVDGLGPNRVRAAPEG